MNSHKNFNFHAIELVKGKRQTQIHSFRAFLSTRMFVCLCMCFNSYFFSPIFEFISWDIMLIIGDPFAFTYFFHIIFDVLLCRISSFCKSTRFHCLPSAMVLSSLSSSTGKTIEMRRRVVSVCCTFTIHQNVVGKMVIWESNSYLLCARRSQKTFHHFIACCSFQCYLISNVCLLLLPHVSV